MKLQINEPWITNKVRCQNGYVYIDKGFWKTTNANISESSMVRHSHRIKHFTDLKPNISKVLLHQKLDQFLLIYVLDSFTEQLISLIRSVITLVLHLILANVLALFRDRYFLWLTILF